MDLLFTLPETASVPVNGGGRFPVRRVFCVGRNYEAHAAEMGVAVDREKPFYFTKSAAHVVPSGSTQPYPKGTTNYHFEIEMAVYFGPEGLFGYGAALDMTRRDLQLSERAHQRPWSLGKDVEGSAVLAPITRAAAWQPNGQRIQLSQNGTLRQDGTLSELIWSVPEIIAHLGGFYTLGAGDVILTGTPSGVGPVAPGDDINAQIEGLAPLSLQIGPPQE